MKKFMTIPSKLLEELDAKQMISIYGGDNTRPVANNGSGICTGVNNSDGKCAGTNNGTGVCGKFD